MQNHFADLNLKANPTKDEILIP